MEVIDEFIFTEEAEQFASSVATMTLYQLLLGRDPENSNVIEENKTQPIRALFRSFIRSAEFSDFVLSPLQRKARLRHELTSPAPSARQREWLASLLVMPSTQLVAIVMAPSWRSFFCALLGLPADDKVDVVPQQTDHPVVLAEISEIELRLQRLKDLIQKTGDGESR